MEKWKRVLSKNRDDLVMLAGGAAVAVGAGMIFFPAGWITAGVLAIAWSVLDSLGGGEET